jgi:hypothetical protein
MTALPELPPPRAMVKMLTNPNPYANASQVGPLGYTADQMRAYGESCRIAGMEAAAVICERINTESGGGFEPFADAIRAAASVQSERHRTA